MWIEYMVVFVRWLCESQGSLSLSEVGVLAFCHRKVRYLRVLGTIKASINISPLPGWYLVSP